MMVMRSTQVSVLAVLRLSNTIKIIKPNLKMLYHIFKSVSRAEMLHSIKVYVQLYAFVYMYIIWLYIIYSTIIFIKHCIFTILWGDALRVDFVKPPKGTYNNVGIFRLIPNMSKKSWVFVVKSDTQKSHCSCNNIDDCICITSCE